MKRSLIGLLAVTGIAAIAAVFILRGEKFETAIQFAGNGFKSLKCNDIEILKDGEFRVQSVTLKRADGSIYQGSTDGPVEVDPALHRLTKRLPWGTINVEYGASGNQVSLAITTSNASKSETIQGVHYEPFTLRFPSKVVQYDGSTPLLAHSVGDVAVVKVTYGSSSLAIVNADVDKPLMIGFPWAMDRPANMIFPLSVHTGTVANYPDSYPIINRPIPPSGTDQYHILLRFGPGKASELDLARDAYENFGKAFPPRINWPDRRPIGVVFLASIPQDWPGNPRGWFGDPRINLSGPSGRTVFRERLLARADDSIAILRSMHAQGVIMWDIEGQERQSTIGFVGDPRKVNDLAPEMADVVDLYMSRFRDAGLRIGVCVRPQQLIVAPGGRSAKQVPVDDAVKLLIEKIRYAKDRWGISLAYVASNTDAKDVNPMDAAILRTVADAFPDVLLIPERSNLAYYAFSAPYHELRQGYVSTPESVRAAYAKAFTLIYTADGPIDLYRKSLASAVKRGDVLMYRTWYADPQNEKLKTLTTP